MSPNMRNEDKAPCKNTMNWAYSCIDIIITFISFCFLGKSHFHLFCEAAPKVCYIACIINNRCWRSIKHSFDAFLERYQEFINKRNQFFFFEILGKTNKIYWPRLSHWFIKWIWHWPNLDIFLTISLTSLMVVTNMISKLRPGPNSSLTFIFT